MPKRIRAGIQGHGAEPTKLPQPGAKDVGILNKGQPWEQVSGCAHLQARGDLCQGSFSYVRSGRCSCNLI